MKSPWKFFSFASVEFCMLERYTRKALKGPMLLTIYPKIRSDS